ncbi:autotransporter outer membrane beta-barrel domain-containing protein [Bartonella sp. PS7NMGDW]|uniref:autotransporter outer membrane beta-barrel domain-containing protein n=1 Tax=Bartonella sp. PS7NMGDW TaxID=3243574 RepID=UPI0035CF8B56
MINVFKKRTRLYALTTSAFFFLQGVDTSMGSSWFTLPSISLPSLSSLSSSLSSLSSSLTSLGRGSSSGATTSPEGVETSGRAQSRTGDSVDSGSVQDQARIESVLSSIRPISACHSRKNNVFVPGMIRNIAGSSVRVAGGAGAVPNVASGAGAVPNVAGGISDGVGAVPGVLGSGVLSTQIKTVEKVAQEGVPGGFSGSLALVQDTLSGNIAGAGGLNTVGQQRPIIISGVPSGENITNLPAIPGVGPGIMANDTLSSMPDVPGTGGVPTRRARATRAEHVEAKTATTGGRRARAGFASVPSGLDGELARVLDVPKTVDLGKLFNIPRGDNSSGGAQTYFPVGEEALSVQKASVDGLGGMPGISSSLLNSLPADVSGNVIPGVSVSVPVGNGVGAIEFIDSVEAGGLADLINGDQRIYGSIYCNQSGVYTLIGGTIIADQGENAVNVESPSDDGKVVVNLEEVSIESMKIEKELSESLSSAGIKNDKVDIENISNLYSRDPLYVGVYIGDSSQNMNAEVNLKNSNIQGFFIGLRAEGTGKITMVGGGIRDTYIGALASDGGQIFLENVDINVKRIGLVSSDASVIGMKSGAINVKEGGRGVISTEEGIVLLDGTAITVAEEPKTQEADASEMSIGLLSLGGTISFKNGELKASDTIALLVSGNSENNVYGVSDALDVGEDDSDDDDSDDDDSDGGDVALKQQNLDTDGVVGEVISIESEAGAVLDSVSSAFFEVLSSVEDFLGGDADSKDANASSGINASSRIAAEGSADASNADSRVIKLIVSDIQNSTIKLTGESRGVFFGDVPSNVREENGQTSVREESGQHGQQNLVEGGTKDNRDSLHAVLLKNTSLKVPDGVVVYANSLDGYVVVKDDSTLSGDLVLKAEEGAHLSVLVEDSVVMGGAYVDEESQARLFLSGGSEWYLTKNLHNSLEDSDTGCVDSCLSSMKLVDSNVRFFTSLKDGSTSKKDIEYRTLRIGNGKGTVYSASAASAASAASGAPDAFGATIYFNANLMPSNTEKSTEKSQISDRLLIHGDVSGKTMVVVNDTSDGIPQKDTPHSISIIQVFGNAERDSFKLKGDYITREGLPYKYVLRAYGPTVPPKMQYFDKTLLRNSRSVWDFRLENEYFIPLVSAYTATANFQPVFKVKPLVAVASPKTEVDTNADTGAGEVNNEFTTSLVHRESASVVSVQGNSLLRSETSDEFYEDDEDDEYDEYDDYSEYDEEDDFEEFVLSGDLMPTVLPVTPSSSSVTSPVSGNLAPLVPPRVNLSGKSDTGRGLVISADEISVTPGYHTVSKRPLPIKSAAAMRSSSPVVSETSAIPSNGAAAMRSSASVVSETPAIPSNGASAMKPSASVVSETPAISSNVASAMKPSAPVVSETPAVSSKGASSINASAPVVSETPAVSSKGASSINASASVVSETSTVSSNRAVAMKPSSPVVSVKPVASSRAVGRVLMISNAGGGDVSSKKTVSSTCDAIQNNGVKALQTPYSCSDGQSRTITNLTLKASDKTQHPMHVKNQDTVIKLEGATISGADFSGRKNNVDFNEIHAVSAVLAEDKAEVILDKKSKIQSSVIGLEAQSGGKVKMTGGTVDALYVGALAGSGSSVNLKDTKINVTGDLAAAGLVSLAGKVSMDSGAITLTKGVAVRSEAGGSVELDKVDITAKKGQGKLDSADNFGRAAFLLSDNASVDFKNGNVVTDAHALWIMKSDDNVVETGSSRRRRSSEVRPTTNHANIESSIVRVEGDGTYGIYFDGGIQKEASQQNRSEDLATEKAIVVKRSTVSKQEKTPISITGTVSLKKTDFEVASGIAIYGNNSGGHVSLENKTTLVGDLLLKADNDSNISVLVDSSIVKGDVRVDKSSYAKLDLINQSEWILKRSAQRNLGTPDLGCVDSCISSVSLVNSTIDFASSESEGKYQTLHIGNGKGIVYAAQGNAAIHLNARLNPRDPSNQQVTDRLVIHGDVSGKTKIHVRGDAGNVGDGKANAKIAHTVSIIQVYGQAKKDSFQLDGNYVALRNSPYKYTLRAYGPEATSKQEHVQQKFVKDGGEFWNFRLENQYVKSVGSAVLPEQFVRSVVPQVPTYLVLPNSVFHAGLMDISNQNKQLETLRMTSTGMVEVRENPALYLRGYGGSYRYASDLSALEYGYGGDLDYHGVEAGVLLQTIENADSAISFGVMGTYGKLSLQPLNVEQSQKSAFDKWTATVYGSMQHNAGFYVDGLLSYGLFKGDVLTLARGKTATLKGNPLSVSLAGGQTIATGYKGFVFDPQVQVVYQHLQFNKARDIDNFDIEMGNLNQWVARVGGRLTKIPTGSEGVNAIAFYGKLYLAHGFEGKQSVHFNDAFKLGAFGSSLEAGLGFNAKLLPQFSLHADILYQHKLNKAGFSGASFSGGVRYQF